MTEDKSYRKILVAREGPVLTIKINRPEKRNAIDDELLLEIEQAFLQTDPSVKCILLCGEGDHFSAGLDLSALEEKDAVAGLRHSLMWHRVMDHIRFGLAPVIAVLRGACVGGGLELAAACHIRVAEESAFYALPEGQRGIFMGGGGSVHLPGLIGLAVMTDMMLTGRVIPAAEGSRLGFSQYLVENGKGMDHARGLAEKISANSSLTNYALTHVLPRIADSPREQGLMMESLMAAIAQQSPEAKERLKLFLEGKAPKLGGA
ncbi:MAG TPA: crotonase/enoyl-CoA hydratase family protein [Saprospiraceae bacterium]|nr:crotonase/enoyl-CoA hydratase family protein [Saprospiraceae bacterium]